MGNGKGRFVYSMEVYSWAYFATSQLSTLANNGFGVESTFGMDVPELLVFFLDAVVPRCSKYYTILFMLLQIQRDP